MRFYYKMGNGEVFYSDGVTLESIKLLQDINCVVYSNQKVYTNEMGRDIPEEEWLLIILKAKPLE